MQIAIFSTKKTARLSYILDFIFGDFFDISYEIITKESDFDLFQGPKICYSRKTKLEAVKIIPHPLLFEEGINHQRVSLQNWNGENGIFHTSPDTNIFSIDVFAQSFYFISKYEEYINPSFDEFGRFKGIDSFAYKNGIHLKPIVDIWLIKLKESLEKKFPLYPIPLKTCKPILPTIDIDHPWEIKYISLPIQMAKIGKTLLKGQLKKTLHFLKVILGMKPDSYHSYERLMSCLQSNPNTLLFILLSNSSYPDQNRHVFHRAFKQLLKKLNQLFELGIHPSISSNRHNSILENELKIFENLVGKKAENSRQHYLVTQFPKTYNNLLQAGIQHEYSMGYHDICGFRAGTARSFYWYNLELEQSTKLRVHAFQWMDVSLKNYLELSPMEAIKLVETIKLEIKKVKGTASFIWHNSSFDPYSGWGDWDQVFDCSLNPGMQD